MGIGFWLMFYEPRFDVDASSAYLSPVHFRTKIRLQCLGFISLTCEATTGWMISEHEQSTPQFGGKACWYARAPAAPLVN